MSKRASSQPHHTARTAAGKAARADRLAAEMRKNLVKRKHQQREKSVAVDGECVDEAASPRRPATPSE